MTNVEREDVKKLKEMGALFAEYMDKIKGFIKVIREVQGIEEEVDKIDFDRYEVRIYFEMGNPYREPAQRAIYWEEFAEGIEAYREKLLREREDEEEGEIKKCCFCNEDAETEYLHFSLCFLCKERVMAIIKNLTKESEV